MDANVIEQLQPYVTVRSVPSSSRKSRLKLFKSKTERFGDYVSGPVLGQGSSAIVQKVFRDNKVFAAKLIPKTSLDSDVLSSLVNELKSLQRLKHKHIIRVHEVVIDEKHLGIIMDWACNGDLFGYLKRNGPIDEAQAKVWFSQLVTAVDYLHSECIVHRDIKPENILVDADKNLVLTDFEMCHDFHAQGFPFVEGSCGSPTYCAPEAVCCPHKLQDGCKADIWALGITLFTCASGYLPYDDSKFPSQTKKEIKVLYRHIVATPLLCPPWISEDLENLLQHMLDKSCETRATIADVRKHPWISSHANSRKACARPLIKKYDHSISDIYL